MFGIIRPCRHRLGGELAAAWQAHLCGLCLSLRDDHGQAARLATNYDGLIVSVLAEAQADGAPERRAAGRCALRRMRRADVAAGDCARLAATVSLVLAAAKMRDHADDRDGALGRRGIRDAAGALAKRWTAAGARTGGELGFEAGVLTEAAGRQGAVEAAAGPGTPLLAVTEPTETATAAAFGYTAMLAGKPGNEAALAEAGKLFGRVAHLLDAVEDLAADQASGAWNPLLATGAGVGEARRLCDDALLGIRLALAEAEFTDSRLVTALLVNELGRSVRRTFGHAGGARPGKGHAEWPATGQGMGYGMLQDASRADLLVANAKLVATCDGSRRELPGGWVAITGGLISGVGSSLDPPPAAVSVLDAAGCLVTPGLINTHHHIYQNLTRSYGPAINGTLFQWLAVLYPLWARIDEEAAYLSAWVGLAELALGGCTTTTDHLYVAPRGGGDLWSAEISAAREVGMRFHPTRGSMTVGVKDGGLTPDSVVQDDDEVLADSERLVARHHDASFGAMVRVALAPCSPFSVSPGLMRRTAELAEKLDVRLHTHLAEDPDEDAYCLATFGRRPVEQFEEVGWLTSRSWVAHCIYPNPAEVSRLGAAGVGVAHCPSSNMLIGGGGFAPVRELRAAGAPVGLGCDGSASTDSASLWTESRAALLLGRQRLGPSGMTAREVLDIATRGSALCLGRAGEIGELSVGAVGDLVCWPQEGVRYAGALADPVEAWLRCGPVSARHTVVAGRVLVRDGVLTMPGVEEKLRRHAAAAARVQGVPA